VSSVPVEVVLFDLGGVVCHFRPDRRLRALASASGLSESEIHARIWESGLDASFDSGQYATVEAHRAVADALGTPIALDDLMAAWIRAWEPCPDVLAVVETVRRALRTGLMTDNGPILLDAMPASFPEITRAFDWLFFSCALQATKPSRAVFDEVVRRIAIPPARVLLIDDSAKNVDGARSCGLQALVYTTVTRLREDLQSLGVFRTS